jgi:hypothetical protein
MVAKYFCREDVCNDRPVYEIAGDGCYLFCTRDMGSPPSVGWALAEQVCEESAAGAMDHRYCCRNQQGPPNSAGWSARRIGDTPPAVKVCADEGIDYTVSGADDERFNGDYTAPVVDADTITIILEPDRHVLH